MAYLLAWALYLAMAALVLFIFVRYLIALLPSPEWRRMLTALVAVLLFTPGFVAGHGEAVHVAPAAIGVLFGLLAKSPEAMAKAALPLLLAACLVYAVLFALGPRRPRADVD